MLAKEGFTRQGVHAKLTKKQNLSRFFREDRKGKIALKRKQRDYFAIVIEQ